MINTFHSDKNKKGRESGMIWCARIVLLSLCLAKSGGVMTAHAQKTDPESVPLTSLYMAERTVSLEFRDVPIEEALRTLAREARVGLSYNADLLPGKKVSMKFESASLFPAVTRLLEGTGLVAVIAPNRTTLTIQKAPVVEGEILFQERVQGQVVDASTGHSLPGVNILVKGTSTGTVTDAQGNFSLTVPTLNETLVISYIGYHTQEVALNGRVTLNLSLEPSVMTGEEMVVTAFGLQRWSGYGIARFMYLAPIID